jgi:hypothetical protein
MVRVSPTSSLLEPEVMSMIHDAGAKTSVNMMWNADPAAERGDVEAHLDVYAGGIDVIQTDWPHWVLMALDRLPPAEPDAG